MIAALFPELLAVGGVQTAGRQTAAALAAIARERGTPYRFFSLNDPSGEHEIRVGNSQFTFRGFGRAKLPFVLAGIRLARAGSHVVVAGHPHLAPAAAAMKRLAPSLRVVVLTHGIEVWTPMPAMRRCSLRYADCVVAPSRDTAHKLATVQGVPKEKISWLPWALDPDFLRLAETSEQNPPPPDFPRGSVILTVGRWAANERYKGLDLLVQVLPTLLPSLPNLHLVAVGDGDDRPRLEKLAVELHVADRVLFLKRVPANELVALYTHADVFALPSSGEGFGFVFLEAMALGKAVVGGAHGGITDLIEDGVTGFLVDQHDSVRLIDVLRRLLLDEPLRREMGRRARESVLGHYRFEDFQSALQEILQGHRLVLSSSA
jgi:phosphatidylinositol alpha-1,6-mannosyltransferase